MKNTIASLINEANQHLVTYQSKLVIIGRDLYLYLPKNNFKEVQKSIKHLGLVINGNRTITSISNDVSYKVKILIRAVKPNFSLSNDTNGSIKLEFRKTAENKGYYYLGQHTHEEVEDIILLFIELNLIGFTDKEICKMFERKYKRK